MLKDFKAWIDTEIKDLARYQENNMMWGKQAEAIRIREMLRQYEEKLGEGFCKKYCKYYEVYPENEHERMKKERCEACPIAKF